MTVVANSIVSITIKAIKYFPPEAKLANSMESKIPIARRLLFLYFPI